jgi:hypothetical protein
MQVKQSSATTVAQGRLAGYTRHHPEDNEGRARLVQRYNFLRAQDWAREVAAQAPPLSDEQRAAIARIVLGGDDQRTAS